MDGSVDSPDHLEGGRYNLAWQESLIEGTCAGCNSVGPVIPLASSTQCCLSCFGTGEFTSGLGGALSRDIRHAILGNRLGIDTRVLDSREAVVARELDLTVPPPFVAEKPVWAFCCSSPATHEGSAGSTREFTLLARKLGLVDPVDAGLADQGGDTGEVEGQDEIKNTKAGASRELFLDLLGRFSASTGFPLPFFRGIWPEVGEKDWSRGTGPRFYLFKCQNCGTHHMRVQFRNP